MGTFETLCIHGVKRQLRVQVCIMYVHAEEIEGQQFILSVQNVYVFLPLRPKARLDGRC